MDVDSVLAEERVIRAWENIFSSLPLDEFFNFFCDFSFMLLLISPVESLLTLGEDGIGIVNRSIVDAIEILKRGLVSIWSSLAGVTYLG